MSSNQKPPLVLIPGHMGTAVDWRFQIEAFAKDREIIVPDQHYWLTSTRDMALDIASRMPARFDLVGWSMGGYIAFELFPLVRGRVRTLSLIHTSARPETEVAHARRQRLIDSIDAEGMAPVLARDTLSNVMNPFCIDAKFHDELVNEKLRLGRHALVNQIKALASRADARTLLTQIDCRTLVVAGHHDAIAPLEHSQEIASILQNGTLHVFDDVGHCSPWERAQDFNALLRDFLE